MDEIWTPLKLLDWTTTRFSGAEIDSPRLDAQVLLARAMECDRVALYTQFDKPMGPEELGRFRDLVKRRLAGEPVAYLVGTQEFWSLELHVDSRVLIPRRDSETVVEIVLDQIQDRRAPVAIADVCTGSGALALALAKELTQAKVVATDCSSDALAVAGENAEHHNLQDRVELALGDLLAALDASMAFDYLVSNPPYVRTGELATLSAEVACEPTLALDGGTDGLDFVRRLVRGAPGHLVSGGMLVVEHGFDQSAEVVELFAADGRWQPADTRNDLGGNPRVTYARLTSQ